MLLNQERVNLKVGKIKTEVQRNKRKRDPQRRRPRINGGIKENRRNQRKDQEKTLVPVHHPVAPVSPHSARQRRPRPWTSTTTRWPTTSSSSRGLRTGPTLSLKRRERRTHLLMMPSFLRTQLVAIYLPQLVVQVPGWFLAPTGAQVVTICVHSFFCPSVTCLKLLIFIF